MSNKNNNILSRIFRNNYAPAPQPVSFEIVSDQNSNKKTKPRNTFVRSLTAAAQRLTSASIKRSETHKYSVAREWQLEAWKMYNEVGEQHFLVSTLAGQISKAKFFVAKNLDGALAGSEPLAVDDENIQEILDPLGIGPGASTQFKKRLALNLLVTGEAWLVGIPRNKYPSDREYPPNQEIVSQPEIPDFLRLDQAIDDIPIDDLIWKTLSVTEINFLNDEVTLTVPENGGTQISGNVDDFYIIRIWNQHPEKASEPDSATRAVLPVLRELVGLTMHVSAQIDSRLAGAGLLIVPQSVQNTLRERQLAYSDSEVLDEVVEDPFMEDLIETMTVPIKKRDSASAVVPLVVTVPDEATGKFQYITFNTPLDDEARELRDEAIRRLALGQDAPPEVLLGSGSLNHWGAWIVQEETISTHIAPHLAVICDALTEEYLRPILEAQGMTPEDAAEYSVWYDVSHLVTRPNRGRDALSLYQSGELSGTALREVHGFDESAAPNYDPEAKATVDEDIREQATRSALDLVARAPSILSDKTIGELIDEIEAALRNEDAPEKINSDSQTTSENNTGAGEIPETDQNDAEEEDA